MTVNQIITIVLLLGSAAAATAHFVFQRREDGRAAALKPLPVALLIVLVIIVPQPVAPFYKAAVLLGLLLALLAEVLLLVRSPLVVGLTVAALGHFVYFVGVASQTTFQLSTLWGLLIVALFAAGVYRFWHALRLEREPALALISGLTLFAWAALDFLLQTRTLSATLALTSAALFALAIAVRGWVHYRRFPTVALEDASQDAPQKDVSYEIAWGLAYLAQALIALSVRGEFF